MVEIRAQLKITLMALALSPHSFGLSSAAEVNKRLANRIHRVIVASCDRCERISEMRAEAEKWLLSSRVTVGTVEWYSSELSAANEEAVGKSVTDTDFPAWKATYAQQDAHLWAEAIRLGKRLGL